MSPAVIVGTVDCAVPPHSQEEVPTIQLDLDNAAPGLYRRA